ncbi:MAG: LysR family transcriptional regulator [Colwellia sp.]
MDISKADLNLLKVFLVLSEELNVTRAANRLHLSQSAVSASLRRLRDLYQDPLFTRAQVGVVPTTKALKMKPAIEEALNQIKATLSPSKEVDYLSIERNITIGLSDDFELTFGKKIIDGINDIASNFTVIFRQTNSVLVEEALLSRKIDISISGGGIKDPRLNSYSVGSAGYKCIFDKKVCSQGSPLTLEKFVSLEHLLVSYSGISGAVDDGLRELGLKRKLKASTSHFSSLSFLLEGSEMVATIPEFAAAALVKNKNLGISSCPISMPNYSIEVGWRREASTDDALMQVRQVLSSILAMHLS